jgi:hypothetical protein
MQRFVSRSSSFYVPKMNWPCLRLCSRKHLSLYAQRWWERDTSTMNKGWAQTHSGFAIHTCMNTGWIKLLHRDVLTLVCYACVYVWKTLNSASEQSHPGFTMHACMNKVDQILCAEPFQPCKTCKYESTLHRASFPSSYMQLWIRLDSGHTPKQHFDIRPCTKNLKAP